MRTKFISPEPLSEGAGVAIVSPASAIDPALIDGAVEALSGAGFRPLVMPHARGVVGSYSADAEERLADMQQALDHTDVAAILCSRGGYGAVHLLDRLRVERPVWLLGFSDVSALHALWLTRGFRSIHCSMAKELTLRRCPADEANRRLLNILSTGRQEPIGWGAHSLNRAGKASGLLIGGNLAVLDGLAATPFDVLTPQWLEGAILVIEDVAEPIYKVERILHRLRLGGVFDVLGGLVVGQFTDYRPDRNFALMEQMIASVTAAYDFPVAYNAPFGHVDRNLPFVEGSEVELEVTDRGAQLSF